MYSILKFVNEPIFNHGSGNIQDMDPVTIKTNIDNGVKAILSIDIGIKHLGFSVMLVTEEWTVKEVCWIDMVDISKLNHVCVSKENCQLHHENTFCDWLEHFFQEQGDFLEECDHIIIERQPPQGLVAIEQLIFSRYRDKAVLVSPRSMHKHFRIQDESYEGRKIRTIDIARNMITDSNLIEQLSYYDREHDIADSICLALYWINKKRQIYVKDRRRKKIMGRRINIKSNTMTTEDWFETYRNQNKSEC